MSLDVQYGTVAASVYDSLISAAVPADDAVARLRPYLSGARALEIGIGTGRVAIPAAQLAAELVGVDNSEPMLELCRAKPLPPNLALVEADFRQPLPLEGPFDLAYSTLGSLAYVDSREQLTEALGHVRQLLKPGGVLVLDYYATCVYRPLVELHTVTVPTPHHGGTSTFTITLDGADVLTMATRVDQAGTEAVEFAERILLIEPAEVEACLTKAGFRVEHVDLSDGAQSHDWYVARGTG